MFPTRGGFLPRRYSLSSLWEAAVGPCDVGLGGVGTREWPGGPLTPLPCLSLCPAPPSPHGGGLTAAIGGLLAYLHTPRAALKIFYRQMVTLT